MEETHRRQHARMQRTVETIRVSWENAPDAVTAGRQRGRGLASRVEVPRFTVGDFALVAMVTRRGRHG